MRPEILDALHVGAVIPLTTDRKPCVPFADAAYAEAAASLLFGRFPRAGVGVLTDHRYCVIDVENVAKSGEDGYATLDRLMVEVGTLPPTREHSTKSGGFHLVFRVPEGLAIRSAQGELRGLSMRAPGIDIVAGNAVMRFPGTPGYELVSPAARGIADLPDSWCAAVMDPIVEHVEHRRIEAGSKQRRYAIAALQGEGVEVAQCAAQRNVRLTKAAFKLGRLSPPLEHNEVAAVLIAACEVNGSLREHGRRACMGTITRAWKAGSSKPMRLVG